MRESRYVEAGLVWRVFESDVAAASDTGLLLVHGNISTGLFWRETIEALEGRFHCLAPDLRGFGGTEADGGALAPVRADGGLDDWARELAALAAAAGPRAGVRRWIWVGWSMGGGIVARRLVTDGADLAGAVLVNPVPPHGFGGTRGVPAELCAPDAAGSGGGAANPGFLARLREGDRGEDPFSARGVMRALFFADGFALARPREDALTGEILKTRLGDDFYPGIAKASPNWPGIAPGARGVLNALSPLHCDWSGIVDAAAKPPLLWVRGTRDKIVSDASLVDFGTLGQAGIVPDWPGPERFPPQPMVAQTKAVLDVAAAAGRRVETAAFNCGHSPMLESPTDFAEALARFAASL